MKIRSLFLSDLHLGSRACNSNLILEVLKYFKYEYLVLNGDVIDFWQLGVSRSWSNKHNDVLRLLFKKARDGVKIAYTIGNHDEVLREYEPFTLANISISNQHIHELLNGEKVLFVHGDAFDFIIKSNKWLAKVGNIAYESLIVVNHYYNVCRKAVGLDYWSLSKYLKTETKKRTGILHKFDLSIVEYAKKRGFSKVSAGHLHIPEFKTIDGVLYMNTGDMCETGSLIIETIAGELILITDFKEFLTKEEKYH